jgi:SOS-response transcriptional repressor LexA
MEPEFRRGDIAVVNPNLSGRPGDYVVARVGRETLLRRMGQSGILETLARKYPPVSATAHDVLGRVVERKRLYK